MCIYRLNYPYIFHEIVELSVHCLPKYTKPQLLLRCISDAIPPDCVKLGLEDSGGHSF